MTEKLFIETINAIQKQDELDSEIAKNFAVAFPEAFEVSLRPQNRILQDALINILISEMNDTEGWIEYFLWELNFGKENHRLKVTIDDKEIPLSNPSQLYGLLIYSNPSLKHDQISI